MKKRICLTAKMNNITFVVASQPLEGRRQSQRHLLVNYITESSHLTRPPASVSSNDHHFKAKNYTFQWNMLIPTKNFKNLFILSMRNW